MSPFETPIAIRAYTERPGAEPIASKKPRKPQEASPWTLIFDCETTVDAAQKLRVGFYQIRYEDELSEEGIFYDRDAITAAELDLLETYSQEEALLCIEVDEFRKDVFIRCGYTLRATIVGFNLPFDISRIAIGHGSARGIKRGGFSFQLCRDRRYPRVRIKHLSPRAALIEFASPWKQETPRGMRNRNLKVGWYGGHFVDVKTLAAAILSKRFTLGSLAASLETPSQKLETDEHGAISETYLDYARTDVQVTWECYRDLLARYEEHGLDQPCGKVLSEASLGKGYLQQMGVKPLLACCPDFPRELFGKIFCAYYGGRAEVRIRRSIEEICYCDFKSMYPTVNSLMGLWEFVIADGMSWATTTRKTQQFLDEVKAGDLLNPETWRNLRTIVKLKPDGDLLPVRAKYDEKTHTIGLNYLTANQPLWYTLADCVVSKLLTGKAPVILEALSFKPGPPQRDLQSISIFGRDDYQIDPQKEDLFTRLIDLRDEAKNVKDEIEKTLKIIANSTSYGIFIEINRDDAPKAESLEIFGPDGESFLTRTKAIEEPGKFFHPLLGVLITGAARLMLGLAEKRALDEGLDWAFCDTDSLAIVRPESVTRKTFRQKAQNVIDWFVPLNPYRKPGSILQLEGQNFVIGSKKLEPLYCLAISAKRYALFNLDRIGKPILRKASAHGLGHLIEPYSEEESPSELSAPEVPLSDLGVKRWQHDFWLKIIQAALDGNPDQVSLDWHPSLARPAAQRYSASSPGLLNWMKNWNEGRQCSEQVRPFGFLLSYTPRTGAFLSRIVGEIVDTVSRGRPSKSQAPKPTAPFSGRPDDALKCVFDRETGESVDSEALKTYAEGLAQYHLSPESKFDNGQFLNSGRTGRRHVLAIGIVQIGKEANLVGSAGEERLDSQSVTQFYVSITS